MTRPAFPRQLIILIASVFLLSAVFSTATAREPLRKILVGKTPLSVEVVEKLEDQERGLMYRSSLPENQGMLFVYKHPQEMSFWMKNTLIPLDIAFVGPDGRILNIHHARPLDETILYRSAGEAKYVIETNQGWFDRNGIRPGDRVSLK